MTLELELPESVSEMTVVPFTPGQIAIGCRKVGIYVRISNDSAQRGLGVERQLKKCREIAARMGWIEVDVYNDNDISASTKSKAPRPDFARMMADLRSRRINAVICLNLDRLTRRLLEGVTVFATFAALGVAYADNEGQDTTTSEGRYRINMRLADAQREAERIAERVKAATEQRRENLLADPLASVFGFTRGTFMEHVESEADLIREMFRMASINATMREIGNYCRSTGIAGKGDRDHGPSAVWRPRQVHAVMRRAAYAGLIMVNGELVKAENIKPIVAGEIWLAVQKIMDGRASGPRRVRQDYLLSGMVRCECGARMRAEASRKGARGYATTPLWVCRNQAGSNSACGRVSRSMPLIDEMIDVYMREQFAHNPHSVETVAVDNSDQIATLGIRAEKIQDAVRTGAADLIDASPILRRIREDIRALELAQARSASRSVAERAAAELDQEKVWADPRALPERRLLLRQYVSEVVVSRVPEKVSPKDGGPGRHEAAVASVAIIPA